MANKQRNKRSARKARAAERAQREATLATAAELDSEKRSPLDVSEKRVVAKETKGTKKSSNVPGFFTRVKQYFSDVKGEMRKVVWPNRNELKSCTVAVIAMLIVFGIVIAVVDSGIVRGLIAYAGLRG